MSRLPLLAVLLLILAVALRGTEPTDLGHGLGYLRVRSLEEAIAPLAGKNAVVLDLRQVTATPESIPLFSAALSARPTGSRLFVLVSPDTPDAVAEILQGSLVTLGTKGSRPKPQVEVMQSVDDDRRAYAALTDGTPLPDLVSGKIEKERYDEASLVQEFKNGNHDARPPTGAPKTTASPPRVTDRVLQRAIHLHRALLALQR
ncbi:MAG TPA: hypothetical protein VHN79_00500 [Lacunisphaera sp.]|nr:hypothetical protein [Lacunisphaera sp.]